MLIDRHTLGRLLEAVPPPLLIDRECLARMLSVSPATISRLQAAGKIGPRPIRISPGRIAWRLESIQRWTEAAESVGYLPDRHEWDALTAHDNNGRH